MSPAWQRSRPITFRHASKFAAPDTCFPRAVAGEAYDRFARAMWPQAQRWIRKHSHRFAGIDIVVDDAHDLLRVFAAVDLARALNAQEERLLAELMMSEWPSMLRFPEGLTPEIPSFLIGPR